MPKKDFETQAYSLFRCAVRELPEGNCKKRIEAVIRNRFKKPQEPEEELNPEPEIPRSWVEQLVHAARINNGELTVDEILKLTQQRQSEET